MLIPPDSGTRETPRPGWTGGRYTGCATSSQPPLGKELYRKRKQMIEPVFAHTKHNRQVTRFHATRPDRRAHRVAVTDDNPQPDQAPPPPDSRPRALKRPFGGENRQNSPARAEHHISEAQARIVTRQPRRKPAATARFDRRVLRDQCDTDGTVGVQALDARLELASDEVGAGDALAYEIVNEGTATLMCGYTYRLERRDEPGWTLINRDMFFRAVGLLVEPGDTRQLQAQVPAEAQSGQYRITTTVRQMPPSTSPALDLIAVFQVR